MTDELQAPPRAWRAAALVVFAVAWGGNAFSSLLVAYADELASDPTWLAALFPAYAAALVPGLLLAGPLSDAVGRRATTLAAALLSPVASGLLMLAPIDDAWLLPGRLLAGLASGIAFAAGTAWIQELSLASGVSRERAVARSAAALSAGFLVGPLASSLVAAWAPAPVVLAWIPHLVVAGAALAAGARLAPETVRHADVATRTAVAWRPPNPNRAFWRTTGIHAPWVFLCASTSFAVLPVLLVDVDVLQAGLVTSGTLAASLLAQWVARGRATAAVLRAGLLAAAAGMAAGAVAVDMGGDGARLLPLTTLLLGAAQGWVLVAGLRRTEALAEPGARGALLAIFYSLTYVGFAGPSAFDAAIGWLGPVAPFVAAAVLAAVAAVSVTLRGTAAPAPRPTPDE